ncbi:MAG: phage tail protein [Fimbriimonadaceae bacterium]
MAEPFLAEIRLFSFNFPPKGWAFCNGQLLPISQNQAVFSLLGTIYGGNGTSNFALPNVQGRVLAHGGGGFIQGDMIGTSAHTLIGTEMPAHSHSFAIGASGTSQAPQGNTFGVPNVNPRLQNMYSASANSLANGAMVGDTGGGQAHNNMQPYLVLNYCIALVGIFPSRS